MKRNQIYKIYGKNYKEMTKDLLKVSGLASMLTPDMKIGIKPNLVTPTPAEYGATTHPEVVAGIIEYLQENGFSRIVIIESSWIGDRTSEAYEYCGYREITDRYHVDFIDVQKEPSGLYDCRGMKLRICDRVREIDFMINVPVLKGHGQTRITCALKNMKGLIPNSEKRHFHTMGLHKPIAHLSTGIRQDFIVVDHICGDLELEDGGNPVETDCVMTALDPVMTDSYVCHLLGYAPSDVEYIGLAEALGSGNADLSSCRILVYHRDDDGQVVVKREYPAMEQAGYREKGYLTTDLLEISYAVEDADSCSACYASLAPALLRLKKEGLYERLLENIPGKISIGQGFSGKKGDLGVGNCCKAFTRYVPGCPPDEEAVYQMLLEYIR
ncbi:MAG: DUF362 domain-containing protein [Eubacterium sp.]|nr:DUF362 domain-containing protein [Eubacterium sp.]